MLIQWGSPLLSTLVHVEWVDAIINDVILDTIARSRSSNLSWKFFDLMTFVFHKRSGKDGKLDLLMFFVVRSYVLILQNATKQIFHNKNFKSITFSIRFSMD